MEGLVDFVSDLTTAQIVGYFWPFFLLDMFRYVIVDTVVIIGYLVQQSFSTKEKRAARHALFAEYPLVSIIVPGKNEGKHIPKLVKTLSKQTYKNIEFIVVDDGSDDNTAIICRRLEAQGKISKFISNRIRGGKASGANTALAFSKGKYIIHIDADSYLKTNAIEEILLPFFRYANIGAVGGDVRVANMRETFATRLQGIEYFKTISSGRVAATELGILRIISGAHGAFRRDVLNRIQGWDVGPGLDGDITLKIRKLGYDVIHSVDAVCYTNAPTKFKALVKQRYRWDKSLIRFRLRKHIDILKPSATFRESNVFSILENILFNLLLDIKWFVYFAVLIISYPDNLGYVMIINYVLYLIANIIQYVFVIAIVGRTETLSTTVLFLPLMPFYTGLFLRAIRTYSYIMEVLHKTSYDDVWNPWKVSKVAKKNKL